ncbi:substrate-binding domain-containing protein, partial [Salmonella enterica subsp. enterica serovar Virginia]|nr:substrate-binding domain-containing protein [Salmonella enterica subsp. enterica serovar Virginia]
EEMPPADVIFERMATDVHLREAVNDWARYLSRGVYSVISMFEVLQACEHLHIPVPEKLCVIGIDNEELTRYLSRVALSSVAQGA